MEDRRHTKISLEWTPKSGKRKRGKPVTKSKRTVLKDLGTMSLTWNKAKTLALAQGRYKTC